MAQSISAYALVMPRADADISAQTLTPVAMRITGLNQARFNEATSRGWYHPLTTAVSGTSRKFDRRDLLGLWAMARLLSIRVPLDMAASRANSVRDVADLSPETRTVTWAVWDTGEAVYSDAAPLIDIPAEAIRITFDIPAIRGVITDRLADEA